MAVYTFETVNMKSFIQSQEAIRSDRPFARITLRRAQHTNRHII